MIDYKGYTGVFEFDPDLRLFTGHVVDLRDEVYFEGDSVDTIEASMRRAVDHYLGVCAARGDEPERPFSGKLNVRLGSDVHRAAAVAAAARGESLNTWRARIVEEAARAPGTYACPRCRLGGAVRRLQERPESAASSCSVLTTLEFCCPHAMAARASETE